jgi:hypothetical protein
MGKTKDSGFLRNIVAYDASSHVTLPANLTVGGLLNGYVRTTDMNTMLGGYVPTTRTITINGTTFDLSADRSWTIAGGVTSFNTRTGAITLSSGDVTTALGFTPYNSTNPAGYLTTSTVLNTVLTPYAVGANSAVTATDTIETAIEKLQGQVNARVPSTRTITINGTTFDLSADRSWTIAGGVTSFNTRTGAITLSSGDVTSALGFTPYNSSNPNGYITSSSSISGTSAGVSVTLGGSSATNLLYAQIADNDFARIRVGGDSSNAGWMEIATADDGNEPIYVRQYTGVFGSVTRTATLLDGSGNTSFPGNTYASGFRGNANVGGTGEATWHPAGIYSGSTQWLYGTTYRNGSTTSGQGWMYLDWNFGHSIVGVYSASRYQGVWAMGDAYKLPADGTGTGNLYGLAWSHPNAGGQAGFLSNHGLIHMMYGTAFATISDNIWCRNNITAYSDIRVKENIEVITNAMDKINAIRGVTFTRNDVPDTKKRHAGVIAQEVQKVLPEVITENTSNGHLSVAYGNIVGLTIEGLKEHDIIIKNQAEEIKQLKDIINAFTN